MTMLLLSIVILSAVTLKVDILIVASPSVVKLSTIMLSDVALVAHLA
jgi:hypothetical protein